MLNPDNDTLEWCAKWIEDSLSAETNERTMEFGKNMAMTIRAVKTSPASAAPTVDEAALHEIICPVVHEHCKDLQLPRGINGLEADLIRALTAPVDQNPHA